MTETVLPMTGDPVRDWHRCLFITVALVHAFDVAATELRQSYGPAPNDKLDALRQRVEQAIKDTTPSGVDLGIRIDDEAAALRFALDHVMARLSG